MTRDFNNQRREDPRSDSRSSSSRRYGEERSSHPARPRLNRDMVDRAWENGARQNHADYRTRSESNSHPPRDNRRPNQYSNQFSAQNSTNGRKPYGNRQDSNRPAERSPQSNKGPRPRSFESSMRTFDDQKYNQYERSGYSNQLNRDEYQPGNRGNSQHPNSRSQYQGRPPYRGSQARDYDRDGRQPRSYDRDQRQTRDYDRDGRQPRGYDRDQRQARDYDRDGRQPRSYDRDKRSSRDAAGPDTHNPRWQSRPARQHDNYARKPTESKRYGGGGEQELFEGDYEHFDANNSAQPRTRQNRVDMDASQPLEDRHVTRLADGRVLKGTPNEQHRNAEFWTEIAHESDELIQQIVPSNIREVTTENPVDLPIAASTKEKPKSRTHPASTSMRERKTTKAKVRKSTPKPRSTGPKPSQRGYKWPTPTTPED